MFNRPGVVLMTTEDAKQYSTYIERFTRLVGEMKPGQYGRFRNRLVPRMTEAQFENSVERYMGLGERLGQMMNSGETLDEGLVLEMRGVEAELVLEESLFFPMPKPRTR
ncbi:MAG: hypothetical protein ACE366_25830 [Bradymonadia bacterium]